MISCCLLLRKKCTVESSRHTLLVLQFGEYMRDEDFPAIGSKLGIERASYAFQHDIFSLQRTDVI